MRAGEEILFLAHRMPFPPDRGDKIRATHVLRHLASISPVHVATFAETREDWAQQATLGDCCASYCLAARTKPLPLAGMQALLTRKPVSLTAFSHPRLRRFIRKTLAERPIGAIYVFSGQMGQYVPRRFDGVVLADLVDVDSAKFEAYAAQRAGLGAKAYLREAKLLSQEEERIIRRADRTLLISDAEAALMQQRIAPDLAPKLSVMGNGINAAFFNPEIVSAHDEIAAAPGPHCVFTGQMDYPPNIAAVTRVVERILPALRDTYPDAQFHIVGRAPTSEVTALGQQAGCRVWGAVPDMRPYLKAADLVLAPLTIARGVQNKVLEAMAMARAVLVSPEAATGIPAKPGRDFLVGQDDDALISAALEVFADRQAASQLGAAARAFVQQEMSWSAKLSNLSSWLEKRNAA
ncbi:TIGR03087 family PEP-CTERM/XrtA system glycosyltransferase [Altericroceibacterium endophyticum]|uniref:TIGR03087 family PEP-CTERM/XrtA system glycosyltransferase n=1 Tax=Altericroceibacterium endophyticum TaxID=1808508 RepID=A0A6I4T8E9_9SPHN|nr:TIGR03087 family PEP-CTERM/XrtA system glycosyltransferase [Altericroceibacterium endophyticum]MXO66025.1 TIGR03087 family PEP-CTERM/XrtA system glycosyltransferase [Altericroceibacterium endophyticum]